MRLPFGDLLDAVPQSESTPHLYYLLAWAWVQVFGSGEVGIRSLSALAGTLAVPFAYLAARELVSHRAGVLTALLVAVSPVLVWHGQQARAYALVVLLTTVALWLFARALADPSGRRLAWWAVVSAAALATHWFAAFPFAAQLAWLLAVRPQARARVAAAGAAVAAAGLALLPVALDQAGADRARELIDGSGQLMERVAQIPKQFLVGFDAPLEVPLTLACAALAGYGVAHLRSRGGLVALSVALVAVLVPVFLALGGADYLLTRNVLVAWVPMTVAIAAGLARAGRAGIATGAALAALFAAVTVAVFAEPRYQRDDWRGVAEALGPAPEMRAVLLDDPGDGPPAPSAALALYRPDVVPAAPGVRASEVVYVTLADHRQGSVRRTPGPVAAPDGGTLVERATGPTWSVERYRFAAAPAVVAPGAGQLALTQAPGR